MMEESRSFISDSQLKQYFLEDVMPTGKVLGEGSYATVVEVIYKQAPCAAKKMHDTLTKPYHFGVEDIVKKYKQECQLMTSLRHPNITQFLGLYFLEKSKIPAIVMEKLEMSVDDLLECSPNVPLPLKLSILTDTSSGLVYLHNRPKPIIHRDLTARNVLLTSSLSAKISDLGCSQMVQEQEIRTWSTLPGTFAYMPPEALDESPEYGPSLDVFSFGQLSLYTFIQEFPGDLSPAEISSRSSDDIKKCSEVERRDPFIKKLENNFISLCPEIIDLVKKCLCNDPHGRPISTELHDWLQKLHGRFEKKYGHVNKAINVDQVLFNKELILKDKQIQQLKDSEHQLKTAIKKLKDDNNISESDCSFSSGIIHRCFEEMNNLKSKFNNLEIESWKLRAIKKNLEDENELLEGNICDVQEGIRNLLDEHHQLYEENRTWKAKTKELKDENC